MTCVTRSNRTQNVGIYQVAPKSGTTFSWRSAFSRSAVPKILKNQSKDCPGIHRAISTSVQKNAVAQLESFIGCRATAQEAALVCRQGGVFNLAIEEATYQLGNFLTMRLQSEVPGI